MELIEKLKARTPDVRDDNLLSACLEDAGDIVLGHLYRIWPVEERPTELDPAYAGVQLRIAVYLVNKSSVEGQTSHNAGGTSRSWDDEYIAKLLRPVIPFGRVVG